MLKAINICIILLLFCGYFAKAGFNPAEKSFQRTSDGIIIYPDINLSGNTRAIRLQVVNNNIIRVTASASTTFPEFKSLITVTPKPALVRTWNLIEKSGSITIKTPSIAASVLLSNGAVSFFDKVGKPVVRERSYGRELSATVFEGEQSYNISQTFETSPDDAYYGLGQHQDDQFNYKGRQVYMFQNNTEVAVPLLVSNKNYGILWDNYSITKVGDARDFMPLSSLKLYSKNGDYGWLTASYSNDRNKPADVAFNRAISDINYKYLGSTGELAKEFNLQNGVITYEGSIASNFSGLHKFSFFYAGYTKVWINGKLELDRWRQAWNPGSGLISINLEKGKKYPVKIEWIPDGGESYLDVKWLNPVPEKDVNAFTFASEAGKQLDYYFIAGNSMDEVISGYRTITGKATIVPKWAMGFWQSRERYKTQDEILNTISEFRKRKIPIDNIVLDWSYWKEAEWGSQDFDASRFPDPAGMIKTLHDQYNAKLMISVWPKFYEGIQTYKEFNEKGWLYTRNIADRQRDWIAKGYVSTFYDAFNDEAKKGFWNLINTKLYSKGIDAWWMDASEPDILSNVSPERRKAQMSPLSVGIAAEYLNAYPLENAKGIYYGQRSVDPDKRVFLLTRSGFAGSQHYAATIWSGDIASRWSDMKAQISAGLNFSMSGIPFWTMDAGGFSVERRYENAKGEDLNEWRELNTRWYQFSAFVPLFRVHGQFPYREIFNIAPEDHPAYKSMLYYNKLRYRLMPYLYTLAGMTWHKDYTIMRGLVMDFSKDTAVNNIGDQFMLGPSLLVNPVYTYKAAQRDVYLPAGQGWYHLYSGKYYSGGKHITVDAPYERMPVFVKEGSIVPFGPGLQYTGEKPADTITLNVYTGKDASFTLYEDEDVNYNYEKGAYSNIPVNYTEANKTLTIGNRTGYFNGMLQNRTFKVVWITKNKVKELNIDQKEDAVLGYKGDRVSIQMR